MRILWSERYVFPTLTNTLLAAHILSFTNWSLSLVDLDLFCSWPYGGTLSSFTNNCLQCGHRILQTLIKLSWKQWHAYGTVNHIIVCSIFDTGYCVVPCAPGLLTEAYMSIKYSLIMGIRGQSIQVNWRSQTLLLTSIAVAQSKPCFNVGLLSSRRVVHNLSVHHCHHLCGALTWEFKIDVQIPVIPMREEVLSFHDGCIISYGHGTFCTNKPASVIFVCEHNHLYIGLYLCHTSRREACIAWCVQSQLNLQTVIEVLSSIENGWCNQCAMSRSFQSQVCLTLMQLKQLKGGQLLLDIQGAFSITLPGLCDVV